MKPAGETREDRIRECAYYLWEAGGRPVGRDHEFWLRACEMVAPDEKQPVKRVRRQSKPSQAAEPTRKRSRKSAPVSIEEPAPAG